MPNWCSTNITFYSKDVVAIGALYNKVKEIYDGDASVPNGFGKGWLGDYVNALIPEVKEDVNYRGQILYIGDFHGDDEYCRFAITTETAWSYMIDMWRLILKKYYPTVKLSFIADEPGMELYVKSDDLFYKDKFCIDINICQSKYEDYNGTLEKDSDVQEILDDIFCNVLEERYPGTKKFYESLNQDEILSDDVLGTLRDKVDELSNSDYLYIHEYMIVNDLEETNNGNEYKRHN